ncbi:MAG: TonB-dependent receptor [Tannerellaceae bacterium]|jgi:TonB-linked SusC/RagA family outer membrane protein|nr:TonB-dependent receptor [Tannerellaceae bacterium]
MNKRLNLFILSFLLFALAAVDAVAQSRVTGIVTGANGEAIIGANVLEKGANNGVITDLDGKFALTVSSGAVLQVSYIGYIVQEVRVGNQTALHITLAEDTKALEEVIVVGYSTQKKENLTGAVAAINFNKVASVPVANTTNMLQGRLPGVTLTNNGAQAGRDNPEIRIRGIGTFGNNNPMVLIDGVESSIEQISLIAPDDIDRVSVLKDAASASIYGVRAANGVVLITTKTGFEQKPSITYSGNYAIQEATILPDFVSSYEWAKMYNECWPAKAYTDDMLRKLQDGSDPDHFANTNWAREMFRSAPMTSHHLSVNGGNKDVHYMISAQYFQQDGILKQTANERINFRSNLDAKIGILKVGMNLSGNRQAIDEPNTSVTGEGLMRFLTWFTRPTVPVKYSNGHWAHIDGNPFIGQAVFKNPVESMYTGYNDIKNYRFDALFFGELDIMKGLKLRSSLAYKFYMNDATYFSPKNTVRYDADGKALTTVGNNSLSDYHYLGTAYINENILTYNTRLGENEIALLAGHSIQSSRWDRNSSSKQGFPTDNIYEMDGGTTNPSASGNAEETALQSFFGRINYNYGNRYLAEVNIRHDGSSRMPQSHRYATFPSVSGGWIISNESFMENVPVLSFLKLRASWGELGNQEISNYAYSASLSASGSYYFGDSKQVGMKNTKIPNENIKWETTTITDAGLDASFLDGKISASFDWFEKNTSDILMRLSMPGIFLGSLSAPYQNAGKVQNKGWELSANYVDRKDDLSWEAGFSLSSVENKIIDMRGIENISGNTINREGHPIGSYFGLKAIGIYRTQADLDRVNANGQKILQNNQPPQLGDIMYEDFNDDGNINSSDRQIIGNPFPKMQYSFNLGATYKNFSINLFFQGLSGIYRYNWDETTISNGGNKTSRWLDRYSTTNPNGSMPIMGRSVNDEYSSFWLSKSDYLRLKNVEAGYTFNKKALLNKLGIQSLRLYIAGSNLLTFTSLKDYDPEKFSSDARNDVHPNTRTYSVGINVKF